MSLPIELEKLIVSYLNPIIFKDMMIIDPKNYTRNEYINLAINYEKIYSTKLENLYNLKKDQLILQNKDYSKNIEIINLQLSICLEILDHLEELQILKYKRLNNYFISIKSKGEILDWAYLINIPIQFLPEYCTQNNIFYITFNEDNINLNKDNINFNQYFNIQSSRHDDELLLYTSNKHRFDFSISPYCYSSLLLLFIKIIKQQCGEIHKFLY